MPHIPQQTSGQMPRCKFKLKATMFWILKRNTPPKSKFASKISAYSNSLAKFEWAIIFLYPRKVSPVIEKMACAFAWDLWSLVQRKTIYQCTSYRINKLWTIGLSYKSPSLLWVESNAPPLQIGQQQNKERKSKTGKCPYCALGGWCTRSFLSAHYNARWRQIADVMVLCMKMSQNIWHIKSYIYKKL